MTDAVYVPATPGFTSPAVPAQRAFKKVKDVVKALIVAKNEKGANVDFTDLVATVDADASTITLALKETLVNNYVISGSTSGTLVYNYTPVDFNALITDALGFAATYSEADKDAVIAALPEGFEYSYDEQTQVLTVTVAATTNEFSFGEDNVTLATALFQGKSFQISFVDEAIDLAEILPNRELVLAIEDLLEPVAGN